jgi:hypothetical protein
MESVPANPACSPLAVIAMVGATTIELSLEDNCRQRYSAMIESVPSGK